eukprot:CAMPEP_0197028408 /NCGR_PEP_ID=MMETSP1384-20130603/8103_1 /TAXON_ID=29189 /ORGANISM="Ammonia sp." /LENGTH=91 /DNA_ID=CAMNT_0042457411 /DNA_START=167 /DNA_END=442 /DNA_ORIENTATION=+
MKLQDSHDLVEESEDQAPPGVVDVDEEIVQRINETAGMMAVETGDADLEIVQEINRTAGDMDIVQHVDQTFGESMSDLVQENGERDHYTER